MEKIKAYGLVYKKSPSSKPTLKQVWTNEETCDKRVAEWNEGSNFKAEKVVFDGKVSL